MTTSADRSLESAQRAIDTLRESGFMESWKSGDLSKVLATVHSPKAVEANAHWFDATYHAQMDNLIEYSERKNKAIRRLIDEANSITLYYLKQGDYAKAMEYNRKAMTLQAEITKQETNTADISDLFQQAEISKPETIRLF